MKSIILKFLKIIGITVGSILLFLFLAPILFPGTIAEKVKNFANKRLDGEMNFSNVRLSFFSYFPSLTVSLDDFILKGSAPFKKDTLLSAGQVAFGINIKSLLFDKRINIDEIFISDAAINIQVDEKGAANYNVYVPAKNDAVKNEDSSGTALRLEKIQIENSHLVYNDKSVPMLLDAKGFNYTGNGDLDKAVFDMKSHAKIDMLDFYYDNQPYLINKKLDAELITSINTRSLSFFFRKNNLLINKLPVEFSGELDFRENGYGIDFTANATRTNLDNVITALPPQFISWQEKRKIKGTADLFLTLKGDYIASANAMPSLAFNMKIRDGYIAYEGAPVPVSALFLNLDTKMPSCNPDSLLVKVDSVFFKIDESYLSAVINTRGMNKPHITARLNSQMDLESLDKVFGFSTVDIKGKCVLHVVVDGSYITGRDPHRPHEEKIWSIPSFRLEAVLKDGYFKYNTLPTAVTNINFTINSRCPDNNYRHTGFSINNLSATALNNFIKGNVSVSSLREMLVNASLQSNINLGEIKNIYPVKGTDIAGLLKFNINAKGRYDTARYIYPVIKADILLQKGMIKTSYYPNAISDISMAVKLNNPTGTLAGMAIDIQPASLQFEGNPFQLQASVQNLEDIAYNIKANGKLDIARIYKVFSQKGQDISGFINADVSLHGRQSDAVAGRYNKLDNHGTLAIQNIRATSDYFPEPFFIREGVFKFNQDKMWFNQFLANYGHSDFKMNGYLQNAIEYAISRNARLEGNFNVASKLIDVDEFMALVPASTEATPAKPGAVAAGETTGVIIIPPNLALTLTAAADKVTYNGLNLQNVKAGVVIDRAKIALNKTGFNLVGCEVLMDAVYGSISPVKAFFESHFQAKDFDIKRAYNEIKLFRDMATSAESAEGIISLDYTLKGKLDSGMNPIYPSLEGGGVLSVKDVKMKNHKIFSVVGDKTGKDGIKDPELSKINIKSTIKNNVINVERFKIKSSGFRLRIEGQTNFDGRLKMKMRIGLPPWGIIGIPVSVSGTQQNPKIKIGKEDKEEVPETEYHDEEK